MSKGKHRTREDASGMRGSERRRSPRKPASTIPGLGAASFLAGPEVRLLNISRAGVLLESETRFSTGSHICLKLNAADAVFLLKGRVLRSRTSTQDGHNIIYESAVAFDEDFVLLDQDLSGEQHSEDFGICVKRSPAGKQPSELRTDLLLPQVAGISEEFTIFTEAFLSHQSGTDLRRILDLTLKHGPQA
jgi:hypothetical protein